jgi:hypothetical protein
MDPVRQYPYQLAICQSQGEALCHSPASGADGKCGVLVIWLWFDYEVGEKVFYKGFCL